MAIPWGEAVGRAKLETWVDMDSHAQLLATPWTVASVCGILQASTLERQLQDCTQAWHMVCAQLLSPV